MPAIRPRKEGMNRTLMTTRDVADYLSVPASRVYDCWRTWGLPAIRVGTQLRFRQADIDRWIEAQREGAA